ncbi:hypothetical protein CLV63_12098 [Murinocardiopsis flavida]|uniref:Uncharacterized protein n=1 Tax=Murinocardiopsis flavida TaxID=645275 RepID=A0A2P8D2C7_9ACTN|nr:hypothetical protein [Murinocardiopsis flavida]PSK91372.1 hypothetical protein CLV63_12098 [Murinocardiopsis flavida]
MRWPRRSSLPRDLVNRLELRRGERVLSHAASDSGTLVATLHALHLPGGHAVPWEQIDRARWDDDGLVFVEEGAGEHRFAIADPGALAETVFERVTATILASRRIAIAGESGARLVARRPPGGDTVTWQVHLDDGVDPEDDAVRARVGAALDRLQEQLGV